jgi:hypothetical protein
MGMMWMGGMEFNNSRQASDIAEIRQRGISQDRTITELEHHIARLSLMNQALWELLRDRLNLSDEDLAAKVNEVDVRDGVKDGMITQGPLQCPRCGRISNSRHYKCLYCGLAFERPSTL